MDVNHPRWYEHPLIVLLIVLLIVFVVVTLVTTGVLMLGELG